MLILILSGSLVDVRVLLVQQCFVSEMSDMNCNFLSIDTNIVVSEKSFTRLNSWLRGFDIVVEEINYKEISKQGGLLRCSTLPLIRE